MSHLFYNHVIFYSSQNKSKPTRYRVLKRTLYTTDKSTILRPVIPPPRESPLPEANKDDIILASSEFLMGTPERNQWLEFAQKQPLLAREMLLRVQLDLPSESTKMLTIHKIIIDNAAFVASSLEHAARRSKSMNDGVDVANQQPVNEQRDDQ